jgi:hypothetical protein
MWKTDKIHHNTCLHQIRGGEENSVKECGVTITDRAQHGWLCPMHDRIVNIPHLKARAEAAKGITLA